MEDTVHDRVRRFMNNLKNQKVQRAFAAWSNYLKYLESRKDIFDLLTPCVVTALETAPAQRTPQQLDLIYALIKDMDFAKLLPLEAQRTCCRFMTYELLHSDVVLPRNSGDMESFFIVLTGCVEAAYGTLGKMIFDDARTLTHYQNEGVFKNGRGANAEHDAEIAVKEGATASPLAHVDEIENEHTIAEDAAEAALRQQHYAFLHPHFVDRVWDVTTSVLHNMKQRMDTMKVDASCKRYEPSFDYVKAEDVDGEKLAEAMRARREQCFDEGAVSLEASGTLSATATPDQKATATPFRRTTRQSREDVEPRTSLKLDMSALSHDLATQKCRLFPGEVLTGVNLKARAPNVPAWHFPAQSYVIKSKPNIASCVLIVPRLVIEQAIQDMVNDTVERIADTCCMFSAFRHLPLSRLAHLAKCCSEKDLDARHELLRQFHQITHVYLLVEGCVEVTAYTYLRKGRAVFDPDTLVDLNGRESDASSVEASIAGETMPTLAFAWSCNTGNVEKVKLRFGHRGPGNILGDDAIRCADVNSFVTITTVTPCRVLAIPLTSFRGCIEGLTLRLFDRLRNQTKLTKFVCREALAMTLYDQGQMEYRDFNLEEVYGLDVPTPLRRTAPTTPRAAWIPPTATSGLFLDFITMESGERGVFESHAQRVARFKSTIVNHLLLKHGGLAGIVWKLQTGAEDLPIEEGPGLAAFMLNVAKMVMAEEYYPSELPKLIEATGIDPTAKEQEMLAEQLEALGKSSHVQGRRTPILKRTRSTSVTSKIDKTLLDGRATRFIDLKHETCLESRGRQGIEMIESCAFLLVHLKLSNGQVSCGVDERVSLMDELYPQWSERCAKDPDVILRRRSIKQTAIIMRLQPGVNHRSAAQRICALALSFQADVRDKLSGKHSTHVHYWLRASMAKGSITCTTMHGHFYTSIKGYAADTADRLLHDVLQPRQGHYVLLADSMQQLIASAYATAPLLSGYQLLHKVALNYGLTKDAALGATVDASPVLEGAADVAVHAATLHRTRSFANSAGLALNRAARKEARAANRFSAKGKSIDEEEEEELCTAAYSVVHDRLTSRAQLEVDDDLDGIDSSSMPTRGLPHVLSTKPVYRGGVRFDSDESPTAPTRRRVAILGTLPSMREGHASPKRGFKDVGRKSVSYFGDHHVNHANPRDPWPAITQKSLDAQLAASVAQMSGSLRSLSMGRHQNLLMRHADAHAGGQSTDAADSLARFLSLSDEVEDLYGSNARKQKGASALRVAALAALAAPEQKRGLRMLAKHARAVRAFQRVRNDPTRISTKVDPAIFSDEDVSAKGSRPTSRHATPSPPPRSTLTPPPRTPPWAQTSQHLGPVRSQTGPHSRTLTLSPPAKPSAKSKSPVRAARGRPAVRTAMQARAALRQELLAEYGTEKVGALTLCQKLPFSLDAAKGKLAPNDSDGVEGSVQPALWGQEPDSGVNDHDAMKAGTGPQATRERTGPGREPSRSALIYDEGERIVLSMAKDNGSRLAMQRFAGSLPPGTLYVDFTGLQMSELPELLNPFWLQSLAASFNRLSAMPVFHSAALCALNLAYNEITEIPGDIAISFPGLQDLNLNNNCIRCVPSGLGHLANLRSLGLRRNQLRELPGCIGGLPSLWKLDISENALACLPDSLRGLSELHSFASASNKLHEVPLWMQELTALRDLDMSRNHLEEVPWEVLTALSYLEILDLSHNQLQELRPQNESARAMTPLDACMLEYAQKHGHQCRHPLSLLCNDALDNDGAFPDALRQVAVLGDTVHERQSTRAVTADIPPPPNAESVLRVAVPLERLKVLDLRANRFRAIPSCAPAGLESLYIAENNILELPRWVCKRCTRLVNLDLSLNGLVMLHAEVRGLTDLVLLSVASCPLLRGRGKLAEALRKGANGKQAVAVAQRMGRAEWMEEISSLRQVLAGED